METIKTFVEKHLGIEKRKQETERKKVILGIDVLKTKVEKGPVGSKEELIADVSNEEFFRIIKERNIPEFGRHQ